MRDRFPGEGTHLQRYAARFSCVEINSSFYRPHRRTTYERWAATVSDAFRFAVKIPKEITHTRRLVECDDVLARFLEESSALGVKRGVLLVQLPPSFAFDGPLVGAFFTSLRARYDGLTACEPRHASWFEADADALLTRFEVARVAADPAVVPAAAETGGWPGFAYVRLHGSPRTYYSSYEDARLAALAAELTARDVPAWYIFDNTTLGAATANALALSELVTRRCF